MLRRITVSIQIKLILGFVLVMLIPTIIIASYTITTTSNSLIEHARADSIKNTAQSVRTLEFSMLHIQDDLLFLSGTSTTRDYANELSGSRPTSKGEKSTFRETEISLLRSFLTHRVNAYRRVFIVDKSGQERVGIDNTTGDLVSLSDTELINVADQDFF